MKSFQPTNLSGEVEADETFVGGRIRNSKFTKRGLHRM